MSVIEHLKLMAAIKGIADPKDVKEHIIKVINIYIII